MKLVEGEFFLLQAHPLSFDSRYFGPVLLAVGAATNKFHKYLKGNSIRFFLNLDRDGFAAFAQWSRAWPRAPDLGQSFQPLPAYSPSRF